MSWKSSWDRHRIRISQAGGLALLFIAHPRSQELFIAGFLLALAGEALRWWAAGHIRKGTELARQGPYAMVRHPLYVGSFVMSCGFALMCTSQARWASSAMIWAAVLLTFRWLYSVKIGMEEEDLRGRFEAEFERYRRSVPAAVPDPRLLAEAWRTSDFSWRRALRNKEHRTLLAVLGLAVLLRFKQVYLL